MHKCFKLRHSNVPVRLKLQHPPPRAYTGHLTVHCAREAGNLNVALEGWGIWTGFISISGVIFLCVFSVFARFLVNISFKRVFKRSLKVSSRQISLWKVWAGFDWRRNLSLRRGISVLIGEAFERLFYPEGREFEQINLQKFKGPRGCSGGGCWSFDLTGTKYTLLVSDLLNWKL